MKLIFYLLFILSASATYLRGSNDDYIPNDYIPINTEESFFISYKNGERQDTKYENGKFTPVN